MLFNVLAPLHKTFVSALHSVTNRTAFFSSLLCRPLSPHSHFDRIQMNVNNVFIIIIVVILYIEIVNAW